MSQKAGENERDFGTRIQAQAGRLGESFSQENLITDFTNGIPDNVRTLAASTAPKAVMFSEVNMAA
jgi:hypothetical protein